MRTFVHVLLSAIFTIIAQVTATWFPDCLEGFPALKELQKVNPDLQC